jgi:hypothetical protein
MTNRRFETILLLAVFLCPLFGLDSIALAVAPAEYSSDNDRIFWYIHISDTHIGTRGNQDSSNLNWIVATAKNIIEPEFIVASGDLTDSTNGNWFGWPNGPHQQEWNEYNSILVGHVDASDYYDLPGNHDAYNDQYFDYYINNSIQGVATGQTQISWTRDFVFGTYYFVGVNTAGNDGRPFSLSWPYGDYAGLDTVELDFIEARLIEADTQQADLIIIYGHHAFSDHGISTEIYLNYGASEFIQLMDQNDVPMYGYGHSHELREEFYSTGMDPGIFYFNVASLGKSSDNQYNITAIDCNGISTVTQAVNTWPVVLITAPLDRYLGGVVNPYVYDVPNSNTNPIRALVFDTGSVTQVRYRIDGVGDWYFMTQENPNNSYLWEAVWDASALLGDHTIEVQATGSSTRSDSITVNVVMAVECTDEDGDAYNRESEACGPMDCDDTDPNIHPDAPELCDGKDNDCDGLVPDNEVDSDSDGFMICEGDCNDGDPAINPNASESCDGVDNDCDGNVDEGVTITYYRDADEDGFGDPSNTREACSAPTGYVLDNTDCNDSDATVYPGAPELCDGKDNDCDSVIPANEADADGDGVMVCQGDCNDSDATVYPGAPELCDGIDNDCDSVIPADEADADSDGYRICAGDCNDSNALINPGASEACDGIDNNCDGQIDEGLTTDADGDGHYAIGSCLTPADDCDDMDANSYPGAPELCDGKDNDCDSVVPANEADADGDGVMICAGDCNDTDGTVYPGAPELCDGKDNDCDSVIPVNEADADGDGVMVCSGDCNDTDGTVYPGAPELCDGKDNDCDSVIPANEADADGDGVMICQGDCNDTDGTVYPGAPELCDGKDNDCDSVVPANEVDADGDGVMICQGDCNDSDATVYPGAPELCDGKDNDCNSVIPANEADADGDGYKVCDGDCNDAAAGINPGASEICSGGVDEDCDGYIDSNDSDCAKSGCGAAPLYRDGVVTSSVSAADSFGNAFLPLVPSLLALGLWTVIKRRKKS